VEIVPLDLHNIPNLLDLPLLFFLEKVNLLILNFMGKYVLTLKVDLEAPDVTGFLKKTKSFRP